MSPQWALSSPVQPRSWRRGLRAEAWGTPQGCVLVPGYPRRAPAGSGTHRGLSLRGGRPSPPRQAQRPWRPPPVATPSPRHPHVVLIAAAQTSEQPSQAVSPPGRQQHKAHARDALAFKSSIFFPFIIYIFFPKVTQPSLQHHCGEFTHCPKKRKKKKKHKEKRKKMKQNEN